MPGVSRSARWPRRSACLVCGQLPMCWPVFWCAMPYVSIRPW